MTSREHTILIHKSIVQKEQENKHDRRVCSLVRSFRDILLWFFLVEEWLVKWLKEESTVKDRSTSNSSHREHVHGFSCSHWIWADSISCLTVLIKRMCKTMKYALITKCALIRKVRLTILVYCLCMLSGNGHHVNFRFFAVVTYN